MLKKKALIAPGSSLMYSGNLIFLYHAFHMILPIQDCRRGDIILFTGSDPNSGIVGHMGIVTDNKNGEVEFIHASSSRGVMISGMNSYFVPRFVKVNRIFKY